jgi:hypothetical protein
MLPRACWAVPSRWFGAFAIGSVVSAETVVVVADPLFGDLTDRPVAASVVTVTVGTVTSGACEVPIVSLGHVGGGGTGSHKTSVVGAGPAGAAEVVDTEELVVDGPLVDVVDVEVVTDDVVDELMVVDGTLVVGFEDGEKPTVKRRSHRSSIIQSLLALSVAIVRIVSGSLVYGPSVGANFPAGLPTATVAGS